jgi:hypothetical protein
MGMSSKEKAIVLFDERGEYTGYIYHYYSRKNEAVFIGIRTSLLNIGRKILGLPYAVNNVSYFLLDASIGAIKILDASWTKIVSLENPIGIMDKIIAPKFGFDDDFCFDIWNGYRKVDVPPYTLSFVTASKIKTIQNP